MSRVVFMGTPEFAVPSLASLIASQEVVGVVTQPDRPAGRGRALRKSPVKLLAEREEIPIYQPHSLKTVESGEPVREWKPDIIIVAAFGQILPPHLLNWPGHGCLNVHASLLPRWRGASPIQHAILAGDKTTGISLMRMDVGLDTGPVYKRESIEIGLKTTAADLHDDLAELGGRLLTQSLDDILTGRLIAQPQDDRQATYAPMIKKEAGLIDWHRNSREIDRQIRAMTAWPGAFTSWRGKNLKILSASPYSKETELSGQPGSIQMNHKSITVLAGEGAIELFEIQLAGKQAAPIGEFLHGHLDFIGSVLGK